MKKHEKARKNMKKAGKYLLHKGMQGDIVHLSESCHEQQIP